MRKLTVRLDEKTAARARVKAAERNMSLSRYIGELLRKELRHDDAYEAAYRAWRQDRKPWPLKGPPRWPEFPEKMWSEFTEPTPVAVRLPDGFR